MLLHFFINLSIFLNDLQTLLQLGDDGLEGADLRPESAVGVVVCLEAVLCQEKKLSLHCAL